MADDEITSHLESMNKLAPDARARVSAALKANVASELAGSAITPRAAEFSKGAFFSRSKDAMSLENNQIMEKAATMTPEAFGKFTQNLQALKSGKSSPGS
jgi:hypothetical protein